jgi:hypothetical protein
MSVQVDVTKKEIEASEWPQQRNPNEIMNSDKFISKFAVFLRSIQNCVDVDRAQHFGLTSITFLCQKLRPAGVLNGT